MALPFAKEARARRSSPFPLFLLLWLVISFSACSDTCFTFVSNPPNGTVTIKVTDTTKPACTVAVTHGAIRLVSSATSCTSCAATQQPRHIFITLRGVAAHPGVIADAASSDWRELLPRLASHPMQMDLLSSAEEAQDPAASSYSVLFPRPRTRMDLSQQQRLGNGLVIQQPSSEDSLTVPAGTYRQLRLRLMPNPPAPDDALPETKACHTAGFNCVVVADGRVQPLLLDAASSELRISSDRIPGGSFLVLPGATTILVLDFHLSWALSSPDGHTLQFLPVLTASVSPLPNLSNDPVPARGSPAQQ
jgi:hypothetical protein